MHLFPVIRDGKYGYIDAKGRLRIPIQFAAGMSFSEGLAGVLVEKGDKWGFIDEQGHIVIEPGFDSCRPFSDGLAAVTVDDDNFYIDRTGAPPFELHSYRCESFVNGLARVQLLMIGEVHLIDTRGLFTHTDRDYVLSAFRDGLINCAERDKWGYIRRDGTFQIPPEYKFACPFYEGLAAVSLKKDDVYQFIDTTGRIVIDQDYCGADIQFSEGRCAVWKNQKFGFIDNRGRLVIPYRYYHADHFSDGLAAIQSRKNGMAGYIDPSGELVIPERYAFAEPFEHGVAMVIIGKKMEDRRYGYIDHSGEYVWEPCS